MVFCFMFFNLMSWSTLKKISIAVIPTFQSLSKRLKGLTCWEFNKPINNYVTKALFASLYKKLVDIYDSFNEQMKQSIQKNANE